MFTRMPRLYLLGGALLAAAVWLAPGGGEGISFAAAAATTASAAAATATTSAPGFEIPPLTGPVVDTAHFLSQTTALQLEAYLQRLKDNGGSQIQVVILPSLGGLSIEEAGIKIADAWKIGRVKADDGVLLLVAPAEHKIRIEVGKGREGDLPDITASRIIREVIAPRLRAGERDRAIVEGVLAIVRRTDPDFARSGRQENENQDERGRERHGKISGDTLQLILILLFFTVFILPIFFGRGPGGRGGFWGGGLGGGGFGGGNFGGGGSWGGGGGGFSGGGASGDW